MASSRDIINIQSLNELTSEKDLRGQYVVKFSDSLAFVCSLSLPSRIRQTRTAPNTAAPALAPSVRNLGRARSHRWNILIRSCSSSRT